MKVRLSPIVDREEEIDLGNEAEVRDFLRRAKIVDDAFIKEDMVSVRALCEQPLRLAQKSMWCANDWAAIYDEYQVLLKELEANLKIAYQRYRDELDQYRVFDTWFLFERVDRDCHDIWIDSTLERLNEIISRIQCKSDSVVIPGVRWVRRRKVEW